jgi:hypothetical protein
MWENLTSGLMSGELESKKWADAFRWKFCSQTEQTIKKVIADCSPAIPYYELYGGEPLLYPQIAEVLETIGYNGRTDPKIGVSTVVTPHNGLTII